MCNNVQHQSRASFLHFPYREILMGVYYMKRQQREIEENLVTSTQEEELARPYVHMCSYFHRKSWIQQNQQLYRYRWTPIVNVNKFFSGGLMLAKKGDNFSSYIICIWTHSIHIHIACFQYHSLISKELSRTTFLKTFVTLSPSHLLRTKEIKIYKERILSTSIKCTESYFWLAYSYHWL